MGKVVNPKFHTTRTIIISAKEGTAKKEKHTKIYIGSLKMGYVLFSTFTAEVTQKYKNCLSHTFRNMTHLQDHSKDFLRIFSLTHTLELTRTPYLNRLKACLDGVYRVFIVR